MLSRIVTTLAFLVALHISAPVSAGQREDAIAAADAIMSLLVNQQYQQLWNQRTSAFFKKKVPESSFLANVSMGRGALGNFIEKSLADVVYADRDPASGFKGTIYAITFKTKYAAGSFYERIVVVLEQDGEFRMSGIFGTPAPE
jgi:hypothetical protein